MIRPLLTLSLFLVFLGCSSSNESTEPDAQVYLQESQGEGDSLKIISQTLGIGFSVTDLIVVDKTDSAALFDRLEALLFEFLSNHPKERVQSLSDFYLSETPDILLLQELTQMRQDGELLSDFPNEILAELNSGSAKYSLKYQPLNRIHLKVTRLAGDTLSNGIILSTDSVLDVEFNEGNAIFYPSEFEVDYKDSLFDNLVQFPFLDGNFISERGVQILEFNTGNRDWRLYNTHLEISDNGLASYPKNQATELLFLTQNEIDTTISEVIAGNFNFNPELGAHKILTANFDFTDLYTLTETEIDFNCCLDLDDPSDGNSRQVDYFFGRHLGGDFKVIHREVGPVINDTLAFWPATHSALIAEVVGY